LNKWNALSVDVNTPANLQVQKSMNVLSHHKNDAIYVLDCLCKIMHKAAAKEGDAFSSAVNFDVQDLYVYVFYWFQ
jgi:hypothetical protein